MHATNLYASGLKKTDLFNFHLFSLKMAKVLHSIGSGFVACPSCSLLAGRAQDQRQRAAVEALWPMLCHSLPGTVQHPRVFLGAAREEINKWGSLPIGSMYGVFSYIWVV